MDLHSFALLLAYAGSAVGVVMVAPQIVRTVKHPHLGGVSPWSWAITVVACTLWLTYGLRSGSMPQVPGNVFLVSGAVAIVLLVPAEWSRARRAWALLGVTATLVLFSTYLSPEQVGFFAFGIGLFAVWPQLFETVWLRRGMGPSALSMSSQVLKVVGQVLWLSYALGLLLRVAEVGHEDVGDVGHQVDRVVPDDRDPGGVGSGHRVGLGPLELHRRDSHVPHRRTGRRAPVGGRPGVTLTSCPSRCPSRPAPPACPSRPSSRPSATA